MEPDTDINIKCMSRAIKMESKCSSYHTLSLLQALTLDIIKRLAI